MTSSGTWTSGSKDGRGPSRPFYVDDTNFYNGVFHVRDRTNTLWRAPPITHMPGCFFTRAWLTAYGTPIDTAGAIDEFYFINTAVQELEETFFQTDYLATMQKIDVSHNHFAKLPERMFGWYDNDVLTDFDVSTNRITAVAPTTFAGFGAVEALNVANNLLESLPVDIFRGMHALKRLNLNNNLLTELPGGIFQGLEKIKTLLMQTNRFDRLASDVFAGLTPLTAITMASSRPLSCTDSLLERDADSGSITELKCDCIVTRSKLEGKKDRRDLNEDSDSNDNVNTPPSQKSIAVTKTTFNYPHGDYLAYCMTAAEIASFYTPLTTPPGFDPLHSTAGIVGLDEAWSTIVHAGEPVKFPADGTQEPGTAALYAIFDILEGSSPVRDIDQLRYTPVLKFEGFSSGGILDSDLELALDERKQRSSRETETSAAPASTTRAVPSQQCNKSHADFMPFNWAADHDSSGVETGRTIITCFCAGQVTLDLYVYDGLEPYAAYGQPFESDSVVIKTHTFSVVATDFILVLTDERVSANSKYVVPNRDGVVTDVVVNETHSISPLQIDSEETIVSGGSVEDIAYFLEAAPDGWFVSTHTGEIFGTFTSLGRHNITLMARDKGGQEAIVEALLFDAKMRDVDDASNGPNGLGCTTGEGVDDVPFDLHFTCVCTTEGYNGENCEISLAALEAEAAKAEEESKKPARRQTVAATVSVLVLGLLVVLFIQHQLHVRKLRKLVAQLKALAYGEETVEPDSDAMELVLFDAVDTAQFELVAPLLARGASAFKRHLQTFLLPQTTVLKRAHQLRADEKSAAEQAVLVMFKSNCKVDHLMVDLMEATPEAKHMMIRTIETLASEDWRATDGSGDNVAHRVLEACKKDVLNEEQTIELLECILKEAPTLMSSPNARMRTPTDLAVLCEGKLLVERNFTVVVFDHFQIIDLQNPKYKSETTEVHECKDLRVVDDGVGGRRTVIKLMSDPLQWHRELSARDELTHLKIHVGSIAGHAVSGSFVVPSIVNAGTSAVTNGSSSSSSSNRLISKAPTKGERAVVDYFESWGYTLDSNRTETEDDIEEEGDEFERKVEGKFKPKKAFSFTAGAGTRIDGKTEQRRFSSFWNQGKVAPDDTTFTKARRCSNVLNKINGVLGFQNELENWNRKHKTALNCVSAQDVAKSKRAEARALMQTYPYAIQLPWADRNLAEIISNERLATEPLDAIRQLSQKVLKLLDTLHKAGVVHGDINPKNIVRIDRDLRLVDLDMAIFRGGKQAHLSDRTHATDGNGDNGVVRDDSKGGPACLKTPLVLVEADFKGLQGSSAYVAPELIAWLNTYNVLVSGGQSSGASATTTRHPTTRSTATTTASTAASTAASNTNINTLSATAAAAAGGAAAGGAAGGGARPTEPNAADADHKLLVLGGLSHSPPFERFKNKEQIDLWSFAVTLFEMTTGSALFPNYNNQATPQSIERLLKWDGLQPTDYTPIEQARGKKESTAIVDLLKWCLAADPSVRPTSVAQLLSHAFVDAKAGSMHEHFICNRIKELLEDPACDRPFCKVMISYCWADTNFVLNRLALELAQQVQGLWLDRLGGDQGMGEWTRASMERGVAGADVIVAVVSPSYIKSANCGFEMELAAKLGKTVIPIMLGVPFAEWPPKKVGTTPMTGQFATASGDMKLFVDFTQPEDFFVKFNQELSPRLVATSPKCRQKEKLAAAAAAAVPSSSTPQKLVSTATMLKLSSQISSPVSPLSNSSALPKGGDKEKGGGLLPNRGKCATCGMPVFLNQPRDKTAAGLYFHTNEADCKSQQEQVIGGGKDEHGAGADASGIVVNAADSVADQMVTLTSTTEL